MSLGILNNISALYAQNSLNNTQNSLQNTLQQLSSGSRINSGADDAAGLAVADGLHANEAALTQSTQNATAGIGLLQTADGALSQVTNLLDRAVTLATESANGTLTSGQVSSANQEYQNILTQIGNIGSTTNFNSSNVFSSSATNIVVTDGTSGGLNTYADTVGALTTASVGTSVGVTTPAVAAKAAVVGVTGVTGVTAVNAAAAIDTPILNPTPTASTTSVGATATFALTGSQTEIGGTLKVAVAGGTAITSTITAGSTIAAAVIQLNSDDNFSGAKLVASQGTGQNSNQLIITGPKDDTDAGTNALDLTGSALNGTVAAVSAVIGVTAVTAVTASAAVAAVAASTTIGKGADFTATGVATLDASTAAKVLTTVTSAIADVAYQRGTIGADINQLTSASNVASSEGVNLTSAEESIRATNYGQAASDLSKYQILSQTGISALAQANSVQQEVLKLLQ